MESALGSKRRQYLFTDYINGSTAVPRYLEKEKKMQSCIHLIFSPEISVIIHEKVKTRSRCTGEDK